ncbi:MAG: DUF455 family protein [Acidimicrobiales bacterium]|nr:DUF455 family protein [Acidimicrobiales bacterium]
MKKFMVPDELQRDERFTRTAVPLDFLMAEEVTVEQVEETMMNLLGNDEVRKMMEDGQATGGAPNVFRRVRPDEDDAPVFLKTQMHGIFIGEMQALEAAGRSAWDFTDDDELPWKFQLDMARQCWDETRHVEIYSALLDHVGGEIGEFSENLFLFEFGCSNDPAERVVGVNRCLEGLALDVFNDTIRFGKQADDEAIWRSVDYVAADEVTHVRFGQVWSKALTENDPDRRKKVVAFQRKVDRAFSLGGLRGSYDGANTEQFLPLAIEFRKLAGFTDEDIADVAGAGPKVVASK